MPAKSSAQRRLFGTALGMKRGTTEKTDTPAGKIAETVSEKKIKDFASKPLAKAEGIPGEMTPSEHKKYLQQRSKKVGHIVTSEDAKSGKADWLPRTPIKEVNKSLPERIGNFIGKGKFLKPPYPRPSGEIPKGMEWNPQKGIWVKLRGIKKSDNLFPPQKEEMKRESPSQFKKSQHDTWFNVQKSGGVVKIDLSKASDICPECHQHRPDDDRVKSGMKCRFCAYGNSESSSNEGSD